MQKKELNLFLHEQEWKETEKERERKKKRKKEKERNYRANIVKSVLEKYMQYFHTKNYFGDIVMV